jgi:hypothetical protein
LLRVDRFGEDRRMSKHGAVAVTPSNLVTMKVKVSAMGAIKEVTDILSVVPLAEVFERTKAAAAA